MHKFDDLKCSALNNLWLYVIRDDQDFPLVITSPSGVNLREAQDLVLSITLPSIAYIRCSQDLMLAIIGKKPFPVTFVVT